MQTTTSASVKLQGKRTHSAVSSGGYAGSFTSHRVGGSVCGSSGPRVEMFLAKTVKPKLL